MTAMIQDAPSITDVVPMATGIEPGHSGFNTTGASLSVSTKLMCTGGQTDRAFVPPKPAACCIGMEKRLFPYTTPPAWESKKTGTTQPRLTKSPPPNLNLKWIPMARFRPVFWNGRSMIPANLRIFRHPSRPVLIVSWSWEARPICPAISRPCKARTEM